MSDTVTPLRALASGSPPDPCSTDEYSVAGPCGTWPSRSGRTEFSRACRRRRASTRAVLPLKIRARKTNIQSPVLAERGLRVAGVPSSLALAAAGGLPLAAFDGLKQ